MPGDAGGHRAPSAVDEVDPHARDGTADADRPRRVGRRRLVNGRPDGRLGRPVLVEQARVGEEPEVLFHEPRRAALAGDDRDLEPAHPLGAGAEHLGVERGDAEQARHLLVGHPLREATGVPGLAVGRDDQRASGCERPEDPRDRAVERDARDEEEAPRRGVVEGEAGRGRRAEVAVGHDDALRPARGAGGVEDVGRRVRRHGSGISGERVSRGGLGDVDRRRGDRGQTTAREAALVRTAATSASSRTRRFRVSGYPGSRGTYAAPAQWQPRIPAIMDTERSTKRPTRSPGRTPARASAPASARPARTSSA